MRWKAALVGIFCQKKILISIFWANFHQIQRFDYTESVASMLKAIKVRNYRLILTFSSVLACRHRKQNVKGLGIPEFKTEISSKILLGDMLEWKGTEYPMLLSLNWPMTQIGLFSFQLTTNATILFFLLSLKHPRKFYWKTPSAAEPFSNWDSHLHMFWIQANKFNHLGN